MQTRRVPQCPPRTCLPKLNSSHTAGCATIVKIQVRSLALTSPFLSPVIIAYLGLLIMSLTHNQLGERGSIREKRKCQLVLKPNLLQALFPSASKKLLPVFNAASFKSSREIMLIETVKKFVRETSAFNLIILVKMTDFY